MADLHEPQRTFNRRDADDYAAPPVAPQPGAPMDKTLAGHATRRTPGRPAVLTVDPIRREPIR